MLSAAIVDRLKWCSNFLLGRPELIFQCPRSSRESATGAGSDWPCLPTLSPRQRSPRGRTSEPPTRSAVSVNVILQCSWSVKGDLLCHQLYFLGPCALSFPKYDAINPNCSWFFLITCSISLILYHKVWGTAAHTLFTHVILKKMLVMPVRSCRIHLHCWDFWSFK